jgi:hypothetical protein
MVTGHLFRWCSQPRWFVCPVSSLMHSTTRPCTMASKQLTCPLIRGASIPRRSSKKAALLIYLVMAMAKGSAPVGNGEPAIGAR